jgi:hypothetical protein
MCRKFSFLVSFVLVLGLVAMAQAASIDVTAPGDAVKGAPDDGDWPAAEAPPFVIDNNPATKYLHFKGHLQPTGFAVTPSLSGLVVTGMSFTTANDSPQRDPVAFELYGSNGTIDGPYTLIASGDIVDFAQADPWPRFTKNATPITFANAVAYAHYQVLFTAVRDPAANNYMQIADVELLATVPDLPPNIASMTIGTTHQGDAWESGPSEYTIRGGGHDIWGGNDGFHYVFRPLEGDGKLSVNLASMTAVHTWAKVGLMIRETAADNSKHGMVIVSGGNIAQVAARADTGGGTVEVYSVGGQTEPKELIIERVGNEIKASFWNVVIPGILEDWDTTTFTLTMNSDVYIGMAVCSHEDDTTGLLLERAVLDSVVWPAAPYERPWLLSPADGAVDLPKDEVTLTWMPGDNALSTDVLLGTDPTALSVVANKLLGDETYSPTTLEEGITYYWKLKSQPSGAESAVMSFTTYLPPPPPCGIERCVWEGIGGGLVSDFTSNPAYPDSPSWCDQLTSMASYDFADNYGAWMQGLLWPETSGDYTFWIAADDGCELWLSSDDTAANLVQIAGMARTGRCFGYYFRLLLPAL